MRNAGPTLDVNDASQIVRTVVQDGLMSSLISNIYLG